MSESVAVGRWRRLGLELRRLREARGFSGDALASRLKWSPSKISRVELNKCHISVADVERFLVAVGAPGDVRETVMALARDCVVATSEGVRSDKAGEDEEDVRKVGEWAAVSVPKLLRTESYARVLAESMEPVTRVLRSEIRAAVTQTVNWQRRLRADDPLELDVVLDESVLYRDRGGAALMQEQLEHVLEVMTLPNVGVRVLPLRAETLRETTSFMHFSFDALHGLELPDVVFIERLLERSRIDEEGDVYWYERVFRELWESSESADASERMIKQALSARWS